MTTHVDPLYVPAEVRQASPSAPLILTTGLLTIPVICQFQNTCNRYFSMKDMAANDCISKIIYNFESAAVQSWVMAEEDTLLVLSFKDFLVAFKKKFLPRTWEDNLVQDQISIQGSSHFLTWVNKVHNVNDELKIAKSPYYIPVDCFCLHLIPRLSEGLKHLYKASNVVALGATQGMLDTLTDFDEWLECIHLLKTDLLATQGSNWVARASKAGGTILCDSTTANIPSTPSNQSLPPLSPLTEEEEELLHLHLGCFKCCIFYAGHVGCNCTNPHLDAR